MTDFQGLAERCEKVTGADRELDELIMGALFQREKRQIGTQEEMLDGSWRHIKTAVWVDQTSNNWVSTAAFPFTSSLDTAMTLVPDGWRNFSSDSSIEGRTRWMLTRSAAGHEGWHQRRRGREAEGLPEDDGDELFVCGVACTPVGALSAAALRARAAMTPRALPATPRTAQPVTTHPAGE